MPVTTRQQARAQLRSRSAPGQSTFNKLPQELRDMIYDLVFADDSEIKMPHPLMRVSKKLREETTVAFARNVGPRATFYMACITHHRGHRTGPVITIQGTYSRNEICKGKVTEVLNESISTMGVVSSKRSRQADGASNAPHHTGTQGARLDGNKHHFRRQHGTQDLRQRRHIVVQRCRASVFQEPEDGKTGMSDAQPSGSKPLSKT